MEFSAASAVRRHGGALPERHDEAHDELVHLVAGEAAEAAEVGDVDDDIGPGDVEEEDDPETVGESILSDALD